MAVVGNLALLLDGTMPPAIFLPERKTRPVALDFLLSLSKRELLHLTTSHNVYASPLAAKRFEPVEERKKNLRGVGRKLNSKANDIDFDSDEEYRYGEGEDDDEEEEDEDGIPYNWEDAIKKRMEEIQEMKDLVKKAEELDEEESNEEGKEEETEEEKKQRVRKELEKVAREQAERRQTAQLMFDLGQRAYGRGMYGRSVEFLEAALTIIPRPTLFGGEIQIWLAMAYDANNRRADCLTLYRQLEETHPSIGIRRQAAELRYISQAPKLKITQEEMVSIPLIGSAYDSYASSWTDKYKDKDEKQNWTTTNQLPSSRDYLGDLLQWRPPTGLENNQAFWVALTLWLGLVGAALFLQN
ncbi:hypothetical protein LINGRAHAP2_LOCUS18390 [Linum grandiflorum]